MDSGQVRCGKHSATECYRDAYASWSLTRTNSVLVMVRKTRYRARTELSLSYLHFVRVTVAGRLPSFVSRAFARYRSQRRRFTRANDREREAKEGAKPLTQAFGRAFASEQSERCKRSKCAPGTLPAEFLLVASVKLESDVLWRRNNCTTHLSASDIDEIISSGMFYEPKYGSPQHAVRNRLWNIENQFSAKLGRRG